MRHLKLTLLRCLWYDCNVSFNLQSWDFSKHLYCEFEG